MNLPSDEELRLAIGELSDSECLVARDAFLYGWFKRGEADREAGHD